MKRSGLLLQQVDVVVGGEGRHPVAADAATSKVCVPMEPVDPNTDRVLVIIG